MTMSDQGTTQYLILYNMLQLCVVYNISSNYWEYKNKKLHLAASSIIFIILIPLKQQSNDQNITSQVIKKVKQVIRWSQRRESTSQMIAQPMI